MLASLTLPFTCLAFQGLDLLTCEVVTLDLPSCSSRGERAGSSESLFPTSRVAMRRCLITQELNSSPVMLR